MKKSLLFFMSVAILLAFSFTHIIPIDSGSLAGKVSDEREPLIQAQVQLKKNGLFIAGTVTDFDGNYLIENLEPGTYDMEVSYLGYQTIKQTGVVIKSGKQTIQDLTMNPESEILDEIVVMSPRRSVKRFFGRMKSKVSGAINSSKKESQYHSTPHHSPHRPSHNHPGYIVEEEMEDAFYGNEQYGEIVENKFIDPLDEALSTFSIDVDRAGYSNMRRFIDNGVVPPQDAIRVEEMINYFDYEYEQPRGKDPLAMHTTLTDCPWNDSHHLLHIGMQGKEIDKKDLPASNLVFLIDVSGSMNSVNKLPLVKSSFKMLINNLRDIDRVAIVTYSGRAGVALESTSVKDKKKILSVVQSLGAGGSTAGAQGIRTAYQIAEDNFIDDGNNRVILATDGDFNIGINSVDDLESLIEKKRKTGVFLSVLGYGMGNYKDEKMQTLADKGNGNHAYIDNIQEARKVFVNEFGGTLFTIAKDVKLQIEFNPAHVQAYRLVGYENRLLNKEDFNDDTKDAGELGSGHVVTALYEIVLVGDKSSYAGNVDALKYQKNKKRPATKYNDELATLKFRYKKPDGDKSQLQKKLVSPKSIDLKKCSEDVRFSLAVAQFGLVLRDSDYLKDVDINNIIDLAQHSKGKDEEGYRAEFVCLVKAVKEMDSDLLSSKE